MSEQNEKPRRRHRSREEADRLVGEYGSSGLTQLAFSKLKGIPLKTLTRYIVRQRREAASAGGSGRLLAVKVAERGKSGAELTLLPAAGRRIEVRPGFDAATLQRLVAVVERS